MTDLSQIAVQIARMRRFSDFIPKCQDPRMVPHYREEVARIRAALIAQGVPEGEL